MAMMSGTRKLPPISTSSPREMIASRPSASVLSARTSAAAQLFTTSASSAPVSSARRAAQCTCREPRVPASTSYSRFENPLATSRIASSATTASGARPRFVCRTTPVAFNTRRSERSSRRSSCCSMASSHADSSAGASSGIRRASSTADRTASVTRLRGARPSRRRTPSSRSRVSTAGRARRGSVVTASSPVASSSWCPSAAAVLVAPRRTGCCWCARRP